MRITSLFKTVSRTYVCYIKLFQDNVWFLILNKRRFNQLSGIMKTHIITILVYLHNTFPLRSRGPLADAPVRILLWATVFPQSCVKSSKLWIQNFGNFFNVTGPHILNFWLIFDDDSDGLVLIPKFGPIPKIGPMWIKRYI